MSARRVGAAEAQVAATSFLALFAIVGIALYGLPFSAWAASTWSFR